MKDVHILLVEDNEGDILLTTEAFFAAICSIEDYWFQIVKLPKI